MKMLVMWMKMGRLWRTIAEYRLPKPLIKPWRKEIKGIMKVDRSL
jgi:hypothetical protein